MGSRAYAYVVPYQPDFQRALDELRQREFEEGMYYPIMATPPRFVEDGLAVGPGRQHRTIDEARIAAGATGTRSILDIENVGNKAEFGVARRLTDEELEEYLGTTKPTRSQVLDNLPTHEIERGEAVCVTIYSETGEPVAIFFCGYSCD